VIRSRREGRAATGHLQAHHERAEIMTDNGQDTARCGHGPAVPECEQAGCGGYPAVTTVMDRDRLAIGAETTVFETGDVTEGREITQTVARSTGLPVTDAMVASNGWDIRPGLRKVHGLLFTVGGIDVQLLSYESRPGPLVPGLRWHVVAYVDGTCVARGAEQETSRWKTPVLNAIADAVDVRCDELALAGPGGPDGWLLKNPPVGWRVTHAGHGVITVDEPSRNGGMTLIATVPGGGPRFFDRAGAGWWTARPPTGALPSTTGAGGRVLDVTGVQVDGVEVAVTRHIDLTGDAAPGDEVAALPDEQAVALVHVRSSSPITVDLDGGRQGLANPTWCGLIRLPEGGKAWHAYNLKAATVTCPVCFHLFTCPYASLDGRAEHCTVCAHITSGEDGGHRAASCPGAVPGPDPAFDWSAQADVLVARIERAIADGDFDLADRLIDVGDDYQPRHDIAGHEGWDGMRGLVWTRRKQASGQDDAGADDAGALWAATLGIGA
jgi:hypothetical protein